MMQTNIARLYSSVPPTAAQIKRFEEFLSAKYNDTYKVEWVESQNVTGGFRLEVKSEVYDWSAEGRYEQFKNAISQISTDASHVVPLIKETIQNWTPAALAEEIGTVSSVYDGIATVKGLKKATYGEILIFSSGVRGMVQNISADGIGCILFDDNGDVEEGSSVRRTQRVAGVPAGDAMIGRVVDALGSPIDGGEAIKADAYREIEHAAPGIIDRMPVSRPMQTGILAIDSMFPIGRGQRELIIGDRQTGKTAIAIDTIVNQKGKDVVCIYVAIGQKASSVSTLVSSLKKHGAMDYTIIVAATAADPAPLQYIAPYAGCAIGEYFMEKGQDVLIIYDDLSKHAVAYRSLSLLLDRSPGREAYPGDVFYLHSRLLERSAQLSDVRGGGSITALPIVETQEGDVSAYIPTNIISITDGQIFLESDLFFSGQRPAINVGLSVSRVGGDAQTKAMKKAVGTLRLDLAQYREMKVFTQFASDLDEVTKRQIVYGQGLMQLLRQGQYVPYTVIEQIILLTLALSHSFENIPVSKIDEAAKAVLEHFAKNEGALCGNIQMTGILTEENKKNIAARAVTVLSEFEKR